MDSANLFSLVWFLLLRFGAKMFKQKCLLPGIRDSSVLAGGELLCPPKLKEGEVTGLPRPRGRSSPSTPAEVPSKGPSLQRC